MTTVHVHKSVKRELQRVRKTDPEAATALLDAIRQLKSTTRGGLRLEQPGWRAYLAAPGHALIASGIGTNSIRILAASTLPTMYDADRLRHTAEAVVAPEASTTDREVGVPTPAARSRIVTLNELETYRRPGAAR